MRPGDEFNPYRRFFTAPVPLWLARRKEISAGAKLLYARLCRYAGEAGVAWPREATLAQELGTNERQIRRWVTELEDFALVRIYNPERKGNDYRFLWHPWIEAKDTVEVQDGSADDPEEGEKRQGKSSGHDRTNRPVTGERQDKSSGHDRTNRPVLLHEGVHEKESSPRARKSAAGTGSGSAAKKSSNGKPKPPPHPLHCQTYQRYLERLGCADTRAAANNQALKWMLERDFSPDEIDRCHVFLLSDPWFAERCKPVTLIDIRGRIGTWKQEGQPEKFNAGKQHRQNGKASNTPADKLERARRELAEFKAGR